MSRTHLALSLVAQFGAGCSVPDPSAAPLPDAARPGDGDGGSGGALPTPVVCRASVTPPAVGAKILHVSPSGNDAASGLAPASALRTIAAALAKASAGDVISLEPGATFNEPLTLSKGGSAGRPLVLSSDPKNRARLVVPAGKSAIAISNTGFLIIENLILSGPGMNLTKAVGVRAVSDGGRFAGLAFRNLEVSGFYEGLGILSYVSPADGFSDILIEQVSLHHNLQGGGSTYGTGVASHRDVVVRCSEFYQNPGDPVVTRPSGDGFVLGGVTKGLIESCVAHNNGGQGTNNAGPVGLWAYSADQITIQFSESYNNRALKMDGDGFDLDIGTTNSVIQYCYSHDNVGAGYLLSQAGTTPWRNNVVRYNISENDGSSGRLGAITFYSDPGALGLRDAYVYGNTVYTSVGPALNLTSAPNVAGLFVFNNIFVTAKDQKLVWDWSGSTKAGPTQVVGNLYFASLGKVDFQGFASLEVWRSAQGHEILNGQPHGRFADPLLTQPGGGGGLGDPQRLSTLAAYRLQAGSPALAAGLDPRAFGQDSGGRDFYGAPLPVGVGYDIGAQQRTPPP